MDDQLIVRLVHVDGEPIDSGDRVSLDATLSTPPWLRAAKDANGRYEVLRCDSVPFAPEHLRQLLLRKITLE